MTSGAGIPRRDFLKAGTGLALASALPWQSSAAPVTSKPNVLLIICDQLSWNAISSHGCKWAQTPNLDRLISNGVSFVESHSTNPVCSPARSSIITGRMPVETGVISNSRPIHASVPNIGQWLSPKGYDAVYCGKWHLPGGRPHNTAGFRVLPAGGGQGDLMDNSVARLSANFIANHNGDKPFLLISSLLQPHDICYWAIQNRDLVPPDTPFAELGPPLPALPPNNKSRPMAPAKLASCRGPDFSNEQWRYYRYIYFRQVEMLDHDVGRIFTALEQTGKADNTLVIFTSDHGEGGGRHSHVQKWYPYEEGVKVPLVLSYPGKVRRNVLDSTHLVSGVDIVPTICDYAGVTPPPHMRGFSLRPLLEGTPSEWRDFVSTEHHFIGRMVRTTRFKYVRYDKDPVEQLFDMEADPWEMTNLYQDPAHADIVRAHRERLDQWTAGLIPVPPTPDASLKHRQRRKG